MGCSRLRWLLRADRGAVALPAYRESQMTPDVENTVVLRFADGEYVVPHWWASLAPFRQGPEHGDYVPPLPYTLEEARAVVNRELERGVDSRLLSDWIAANRVRW